MPAKQKKKKNHPLFLTDNIKMDRVLTKIFYIVFQFLKEVLTKICKVQSLDLSFLVVLFYISIYHFLQVFKTLSSVIWKKDFCHKFPFFNRFTQPPNPLNSQNLLSMIKVFVNAPWLTAVFQNYYAMMMLGRTRTVEQN